MTAHKDPTDVRCTVRNNGFDAFGLPILTVDCPNRGNIGIDVCLDCEHITSLQDGAVKGTGLVCHPPEKK
jgi:hypothetical protein